MALRGRFAARGPVVGMLLVGLLTVSLLPATATTDPRSSSDVSITPTQETFEAGEHVSLVVENDEESPLVGTPRFTVKRCPAGPNLCTAYHETVDRWTGERLELAPGENTTVTWDRLTQDDAEAPEGTYKVDLAVNGSDGQRAQATSPAFTLENGTPDRGRTNPGAPRIEVRTPVQGHASANERVTVDVHVEGSDQLDMVGVSIDDEVQATEHDVGREVDIRFTVTLKPGSHTLEATARDESGRANATTISFTVAPARLLTVGPMVLNATGSGGLDDVRWGEEMLFETVTSPASTTGFRTSTTRGAIVLEAPPGTVIVHELSDAWQAQAQGLGLVLEHTSGAQVLLMAPEGSTPTIDGSRILAQTGATGELVMRPVDDDAGGPAIADAILDGRLGAEVDVTDPATPEVVRYGTTNISLSAGEGRVAAILDNDDEEGRSFVVDLGPGMSEGELTIRLDGETLTRADSLRDVLDASDDGDRSEAYVTETPDGDKRVIVSVESFSSHDLVIEAVEGLGAFLTPASVLGAFAVTGVAAWGLFRRPSA